MIGQFSTKIDQLYMSRTENSRWKRILPSFSYRCPGVKVIMLLNQEKKHETSKKLCSGKKGSRKNGVPEINGVKLKIGFKKNGVNGNTMAPSGQIWTFDPRFAASGSELSSAV